MEKISIVRRRSGRTRSAETSALLRARNRFEEQHTVYPLTETADPGPETVASLPGTDGTTGFVVPVSPSDEREMDVDVMLGLDQLDALRSVLPLEEMDVGESREVPVVVTKMSAFQVVFRFGGDGEPLLTTQDVCQLLHVSKSFLYRKIHEGQVPCLRIGRRYRFRRKEVMEALIRM